MIFNDEEEIIEYIKKKYNKRNIDEIINKGNNKKEIVVEPKKEKEKKYIGLMTSEEGKKIKKCRTIIFLIKIKIHWLIPIK